MGKIFLLIYLICYKYYNFFHAHHVFWPQGLVLIYFLQTSRKNHFCVWGKPFEDEERWRKWRWLCPISTSITRHTLKGNSQGKMKKEPSKKFMVKRLRIRNSADQLPLETISKAGTGRKKWKMVVIDLCLGRNDAIHVQGFFNLIAWLKREIFAGIWEWGCIGISTTFYWGRKCQRGFYCMYCWNHVK